MDTATEEFTRERVKSRMVRRAAELWGYAESDLDSFDPLVALLIEACSVEFERVSVAIGNTQNRLLDRLAQVLHPEPDVARPAFGIAQARPVEAQTTVTPALQLSYKRVGSTRTDTTSSEAYFSPLGNYSVVDGAIRMVATTDTLFRVEEGYLKTPVAQRQGMPAVLPYQSLWLGIELAEQVTSLEGVSFFVDWPVEPGRIGYQSILALSKWQIGEQPLTVKAGLNRPNVPSADALEREYNVMHKVEKQALATCERYFVTIETAPASKSLRAQPYPELFLQWFAERDLRPLRHALYWVEIQLPHLVSAQALAGVVVGINCFPVVNRRLKRLTYRLQQTVNIIPLETDRCFLSMRDVRTSQNRQLTSVPLGSMQELDVDTYTIQYGVSRFDDRDARQALTNLQDLLRDESASFAALGEDFLSSVIRELNQALARLEAKVEEKTRKRDTMPYLVIRAKQPGETVFIEYWTSEGEAANRIPAGSKLSPYADTSLRKESAMLVTTTMGGRERPKESEKIRQYKRALLTRNRIVTLEDVRVVCQAELGTQLRDVRVERAFRTGNLPATGFERCIRVSLYPATGSTYSEDDWRQQAQLLQTSLETQSVAALPFDVIVVHVSA